MMTKKVLVFPAPLEHITRNEKNDTNGRFRINRINLARLLRLPIFSSFRLHSLSVRVGGGAARLFRWLMSDETEKSPAFQFYPKDLLSDTDAMAMPAECLGMYLLLLCHDWINDGIPEHEGQWLKLGGYVDHYLDGSDRPVEDRNICLNWLRPRFIKHPTRKGFRTNKRLLKEREKQRERSEKARDAAAERWHGSSKTSALPNAMPNACSSSSSSSSSSKKRERFVKPTKTQLLEHLSPLEADKFLDYYEANGWRIGRNPIKSWEATARNWRRRSGEPIAAPRPEPTAQMELDERKRETAPMPKEFSDLVSKVIDSRKEIIDGKKDEKKTEGKQKKG